MKKLLIIIAVAISAVATIGCRESASGQEDTAKSSDDSVAVVEVEPELVSVPVDTATLKGRWLLERYNSPYFNIEPTGRFAYVLKISGRGLGIKFCANELMTGYTLHGDTLRFHNGVITQVKGPDEPIETAISELLFNSRVKRASLSKFHDTYLTITNESEQSAHFRKIE